MNLIRFGVTFYFDPDSSIAGYAPDGLQFVYARDPIEACEIVKRRIPGAFIDTAAVAGDDEPQPLPAAEMPPAYRAQAQAAASEAGALFASLLGKPIGNGRAGWIAQNAPALPASPASPALPVRKPANMPASTPSSPVAPRLPARPVKPAPRPSRDDTDDMPF